MQILDEAGSREGGVGPTFHSLFKIYRFQPSTRSRKQELSLYQTLYTLGFYYEKSVFNIIDHHIF